MKKLLIGCCVVFLVAGCASQPGKKSTTISAKERTELLVRYGYKPDVKIPASLSQYELKLLQEGENGAVLNQMELGIRAFKMGEYVVAEQALDFVLARIESVYADNENAKQARSLWYDEGRKDYKGEPYERAMAYYYRGLLYLMGAEYDNARASFLGGLLQDAFAEEDQHRSDFALLMFMAGWSAHLMGDEYLAKEAFDELAQFRPDFRPPSRNQNVVVLVETGFAPRKLADGVGHYELVYRRGKQFTEHRTKLMLGSMKQDLYPMEDVFWQASTRGGRTVDRIIEGKVQFRDTSESVGSALSGVANQAVSVSSLFTNSASVSGAASALSLIGVSSMIVASKVNPRVDTRYCEALPDLVHVGMLSLSKAPTATAKFYDQFNNEVPGLDVQAKVKRDSRGNGLLWISAR